MSYVPITYLLAAREEVEPMRKKNRQLLTAAGAGLLLLGSAGPAMAAEDGSALPPFEKADQNHDNRLSKSEAEAVGVPMEKFKKEDLNGDGEISMYGYKYGIRGDYGAGKNDSG